MHSRSTAGSTAQRCRSPRGPLRMAPLGLILLIGFAIACSDSLQVDSGASRSQITPMLKLGVSPTSSDRFLLLAAKEQAIVIQSSPRAVTVHVLGSEAESDAALPPGFVPQAGRVVGNTYVLLGETCRPEEACVATLLKSPVGAVAWTSIQPPSGVDADSSLIDIGTIDGRLYISPGAGTGPAFYLQDGGERWTEVGQPVDAEGMPSSICTSNDRTYKFTVVDGRHPGEALQETAADVDAGSSDNAGTFYAVWVLRSDSEWVRHQIPADDLANPGRNESGEDPVLCSGGRLLLGRQTDGTYLALEAEDSGELRRWALDAPSLSSSSDQPFPSAGLSAADGTLVAEGRVESADEVLAGARVLASSESDRTSAVLVHLADGTVQVRYV